MEGISVIVPVYQAQALITQCIESVLAQTFSRWELLLIDDGSRDRSGAICDEYAARDPRIRVFHKANGGVSSARNLGLEKAQGSCIAFLDADDAFVPQTLETLWSIRESAGADSAGCAHWNVTPDGHKAAELLLPEGVYEAQALREKIVLPLLGNRLTQPVFNGFIWRFLFDARLLQDQHLRFEGAYLEDELFLLEYFCAAQKLAVTEQPLYRYLINPASVTHRYMAHFPQVFARYMERKEELAHRLQLEQAMPLWRENTLWAGLLIAIGNEYAPGNPASPSQRRKAIQQLCAGPDAAHAIAALQPAGLSRNKQLVARLVRGGHFTLLDLLYRLKNRV